MLSLSALGIGAMVVDTDAKVTESQARALVAAGVKGIVRTICHSPAHAADNLTPDELAWLTRAGLAVVGVYQWYPFSGQNGDLGAKLGETAVEGARLAGLVPGAMLALDLEGSFPSKKDAIEYVNAWHRVVAASEFAPGITFYHGPGFPLSSDEIDRLLPDVMAWRSASRLNGEPARGYVMRQGPQTKIAGIVVDTDTVCGNDWKGASLKCMVAAPEVAPQPPPEPSAPIVPTPSPVPVTSSKVGGMWGLLGVAAWSAVLAAAALLHHCQ